MRTGAQPDKQYNTFFPLINQGTLGAIALTFCTYIYFAIQVLMPFLKCLLQPVGIMGNNAAFFKKNNPDWLHLQGHDQRRQSGVPVRPQNEKLCYIFGEKKLL